MVNVKVSNEMASQPPVSIDLVDVKKFIRTRTLDFRFEFTRETVMEVLNALNKMIEFDKIMKTEDKLKVLRINVYSYGGHCASLLRLNKCKKWDIEYILITNQLVVVVDLFSLF